MPFNRNPFPLGKVTATTTTPARLTANFLSDAEITGMIASKIDLKALSGNNGDIYLGYSDMDRATLAGVIALISPGGTWSYSDATSLNSINPHDLYIGVDVNGDGVLATAHVR